MTASSSNVKSVKIELVIHDPATVVVDAHRIAHALFGSGLLRRSGSSSWTARIVGWTMDNEQFVDEATGI